MKKFKWRVRRRLLALSVALSISVAVLGELHAAPSNPTQVKIEAGSEGDPAEAEAYLAANASVVQTRLPEAVRKCAREASSTAVVDFELAIEVRKGGKLAKSAATPSNSFTRCVAEAVRTFTFTEPPHDPLGVHFGYRSRNERPDVYIGVQPPAGGWPGVEVGPALARRG